MLHCLLGSGEYDAPIGNTGNGALLWTTRQLQVSLSVLALISSKGEVLPFAVRK